MEFILGSTSQHKLEALIEACKRLGIQARIGSMSASSGINAQPYGLEETQRGALNRALDARSHIENAVAVGIENGIVPINGKYVDLAVIVILTPEGRTLVSISAGVDFPEDAFEIARKRGFDSTTVGDIITETMGGSSTDPHATVTAGKVTRKNLLIQALMTVLSQI